MNKYFIKAYVGLGDSGLEGLRLDCNMEIGQIRTDDVNCLFFEGWPNENNCDVSSFSVVS